MKSDGEEIIITPCFFDNDDTTDIANAEYFLIHANKLNNLGATHIENIAAILADYEQKVNELAIEKADCQKFYDRNICGKSITSLQLGNTITCEIYSLCMKSSETNFTKFRDTADLSDIANEHGVTTEEIREAVQLADDWDYYSDWYKSLYNRRPNVSEDSEVFE